MRSAFYHAFLLPQLSRERVVDNVLVDLGGFLCARLEKFKGLGVCRRVDEAVDGLCNWCSSHGEAREEEYDHEGGFKQRTTYA